MTTARDVAQYILDLHGPMPAMKLQKLLYYCQAWSLVWDEEPLFTDKIEAWANGPVVRDVWNANRYAYEVSEVRDGRPSRIRRDGMDTIAAVLKHYGDKSATDLSNLTHMEEPWMAARARDGVKAGQPSEEDISTDDMKSYYSSRKRSASAP